MADAEGRVGEVLGDRFEILSHLGQGGMATVYRAKDRTSGEDVAIKVLPRKFAAQTEYVARFLREAEVTEGLRHRHIVRIFGKGRTLDGLPYYAMEYLPYPDLEQVLKAKGALGVKVCLSLTRGLLEALGYTHDRRLFHRDLKPSNVVVAPGPRAVLMDFGLVKDIDRTQLTATGTVVGTPAYMSPELIQGQPAEEASDLYQVGLILYEALTAQRAHQGKDIIELAHRIVAGDIPGIETYRPDLPIEVQAFVHNLLALDPEARYPHAKAAIEDLDALDAGAGVRFRRTEEVDRSSSTQPQGRPPDLQSSAGSRPAFGLSGSHPQHSKSDFPTPMPGVTQSGAQDPLTLSSTGLPVQSRSDFLRRVSLGATLLVSVLLGFFLFGGGVDDMPRNVLVRPGLSGFEIEWETPSKVVGRLEVREGEGGQPWKLYEEDEATSQHALLVEGFAGQRTLEARIRRNDQSLGWQQEVTLKDLRVASLSFAKGPAERVLQIEFSGPIEECILQAQDGSSEVEVLGKRQGPQASQVDLSGLVPSWRNLRALVSLPSGDLVEIPLVEDLVRAIRVCLPPLLELDRNREAKRTFEAISKSSEFIEKLDKLSRQERMRRRRDEAKAFEGYFAGLSWYPQAKRILDFGPWALHQPGLDLEVQVEIYQALDQVYQLFWFLRDRDIKGPLQSFPRDLGGFREDTQSRFSKASDYRSVPVQMPTREFTNLFGKTKEELGLNLDQGLPPEGICELALSLPGTWKHSFGLKVSTPSGGVTFYGVRGFEAKEAQEFFHSLPCALFQRGENSAQIEIVNRPRSLSTHTFKVGELQLRIPTRDSRAADR